MEQDSELRALVGRFSNPPIEAEAISDASRLVDDLGIHSLQLIRLVVQVDTELGVTLSEEHLDPTNFHTYGMFRQMVQSIRAGRNAL